MDGIPLGIELAAAWVNLLTPEQIADRIDADLDLLTNANRTVLPRHQTMHAALEWSYLLLSDLEQQLLRRLSVFIGDWNLAPAEAVTAVRGTDGATVKGIPFLTLISRLANKSLVTVDRLSESEAHYRLLEPIRAYALEKLRAAGEEISARNGHLSYYVVLAERLDGEFEQHIGRADIACLDRETENLRAALAWSLKSGRFEDGLRLAIALGRYWRHRGRHVEGRRWLEALLESSPEPTPLRAQTLLWAGILARRQGDMHVARTFCDDSLMLLRSWDDQISVAIALENMAWTYLDEDRERALAYFDESLALFRRLGRKRQVGRLLTTTAQMLREDARFSQATANLREALSLLRTADDPIGTAQALNGFGRTGFAPW